MKIFLTGSTGVIGSRALPGLVQAGHDVTAVARTDEKAGLVEQLGGIPVRCDLFDAAAVRDAVDGHDVVVNLATHIPPLRKAARTANWATNDRLRTEASGNLVEAATMARASRFVQESICFPYEDQGADWADESTPMSPTSVTASALTAEANTAKFAERGGAAVVLRFAQLYSADSDHVSTFHSMVRKHLPPLLGEPDSYTPFVHADDAAAAVVAAIEAPSGTYNVGDDQPLTRAEANAVIARALGVKTPFTVPSVLLRLAPEKLDALTRSIRVSNTRFRSATDWAPTYRSIREGWPTVVPS